MTAPASFLVLLSFLGQVPLVAPPEPKKAAPQPQPQPAPKKKADPVPLVEPAPEPQAPAPRAAPAAPPSPAPAAPAPQGPTAPQSSGNPLVDKLLQFLPQEPQDDLSIWPVLQPNQERPVIGFRFEAQDGVLQPSYFKDETLKTFVQQPVGKPLNRDTLQADADYIAVQHKLRGFQKATVKWAVDQTDRGDIIVFTMTAGKRGQLKQVDAVGNKGVATDVLLAGLYHKTAGFFSVLDLANLANRGGVYHAGYLEQDSRAIVKNYAGHGYLAAKVNSARIYSLNPEGTELRLVFDVRDGPLFHMGSITFQGDLPLDEKACMATLGMRPGSPAELLVLEAGVERLLDVWRNRSYAGAKATQERKTTDSTATLDVTIRFEKGPVTRVGQVRVMGDPTTADHVITRDVAVREGQLYSLNALRLSEERLMYTGLFQKVTLKPVPTPDPAVVDVEIEVVEAQSWFFSLAPSWIPGEGLVGIGFVGFRNFWAPDLLGGGNKLKPRGQGWRINAQGIVSRRRQTGRLDLEEPRILDTRLSVGGNVHRDRYVYPEFAQVKTGGALTLGYPMIEHSMLSIGYSLERVDFDSGSVVAGYAGSARFPNKRRRASVRFDAAYDRRDNAIFPTRGILVAASMEYGSALLLGEMDFMSVSANARFYIPMPFGFVLKNNTAGGWVFNPRGGVVPVSERYYEGGPIQSVRGYTWQSISPSISLGNPYDPAGATVSARLGGVTRFINNLELETPPIPVFPILPLKCFVFFDAGNTWSESERPFFFPNVFLPERDGTSLPFGMLYSVGVGAMLATQLFPLRIDFTVPITRRPGDEFINFFVSAGSPF